MAPPGPAGGAIWLAQPAWAADKGVARPTGKTTGQPWPCPGPRERDRAGAGRQGRPLAGSPGRARGESVAASLLSLQARPPGRAPAAGLGGQEGLATVLQHCSVLQCTLLQGTRSAFQCCTCPAECGPLAAVRREFSESAGSRSVAPRQLQSLALSFAARHLFTLFQNVLTVCRDGQHGAPAGRDSFPSVSGTFIN